MDGSSWRSVNYFCNTIELIIIINSLLSRMLKADLRKKMTLIMSGSYSFLRSIMTRFLKIGTATRVPTPAYLHRGTGFDVQVKVVYVCA